MVAPAFTSDSILSINAGVIVSMAATSLQAIPITGSIDMNGTVTLNNTSLGMATAAASFSNVEVGGIPTGSYTGVPVNTLINKNPSFFKPLLIVRLQASICLYVNLP